MKTIKVLSWRFNTWVAVIVALGLSYGCSGAAPTALPTTVVTVAAPASPTTVVPSATSQPTLSASPTTTQEAGVKILPRLAGAPQPLEGAYETSPSLPLHLSFTVPTGWYGAQWENSGVVLGQGIDLVREDFVDGGIGLDILPMSMEEAVEAFQNIEGVDAGQPEMTELGGYPAVTFHPFAKEHVELENALGAAIDIGPDKAPGHVVFVEVEGTTAIVRIGVAHEEARSAIYQVLESFQFSP